MVTKLDLKKELKYLYNPSAKAVEEVEVPEFNFAMVKGCCSSRGEGGGGAGVRGGLDRALRDLLLAQVRRQAAQGGAGGLPGDGA